jgi:predicted RNA-binding protein associated with RNAse of E/G family/GNAT superfamily N-acetyltransferase
MTPDEMREAYLTDMVHVFPPYELKPCGDIYDEMKEGKFLACGYYAGEALVAYVFSALLPGGAHLFVQYVVVKAAYRSLGVGGRLMDAICARYAGFRCLFLDVEDAERAADDAERAARARRERFYLRNGFRKTRVKTHVYGMDYAIVARDLSAKVEDEEIYEAARAIYQSMAKPGAYPDKFRTFLRPEDRGMARADWSRLTDRRYRQARVSADGFSGTAGLIEIDAVREPLTVMSALRARDVVIADAGYQWLQLSPDAGGWWLTVMFDAEGALVQYYFDVTFDSYIAPDGEPRFVDAYLDIVMDGSGNWALLDEDELEEARAAGDITQDEYQLACRRAQVLIEMVDGHEDRWRALCETCIKALTK